MATSSCKGLRNGHQFTLTTDYTWDVIGKGFMQVGIVRYREYRCTGCGKKKRKIDYDQPLKKVLEPA